jgi:hypothetical protein
MASPILRLGNIDRGARSEILRLMKTIESGLHKTEPFWQDDFRKAEILVEQLCEPKTPCFELNCTSNFDIIQLHPHTKEKVSVSEMTTLVGNVLYVRGYRTDTLTHQEHLLNSSSAAGKDEPHKPIGIVIGTIGWEAAENARQLELLKVADTWNYTNEEIENSGLLKVPILLERLGQDGNTVSDPRPLNEEKFRKAVADGADLDEAIAISLITPYGKDEKYPYRRD